MTRRQEQTWFAQYWGTALAIASAAIYGLSVWLDDVPNKTAALAAVAGVAAAVKMLAERNKRDTQQAVTWEAILAGMGLKERLNLIEKHTDERHADNSRKLTALVQLSADNAALHAEHISVTDSHGVAITALGHAMSEVKPGFTLPTLRERQRAEGRRMTNDE